jgi:archaellum component FlaG (FlaF/FlaG flagellin family)
MIVVHHTASTTDLDNPKQAIRNIQYYHAVRRGWGDIGYNYLIDQEGNIYEGRKGGEKVIGGHAIPVNKTSIGIAVLGNYEEQQLPGEVAEALVELTSEKAALYKLDLGGTVYYKDRSYDVLQGHRDNSATACPGANLYAALPSIRYIATNGGSNNLSILRNKQLAFLDSDPLRDYIEMEAFDEDTLRIKIQNVGKETWSRNSTFLRSVNGSIYGDMDVDAVTKMNESSVSSGSTATFDIDVESGLIPGYKGLKFIASLNGETIDRYPLFAPVFVEKPDLSFSIVSGDNERISMAAGETKTLEFKLKNTGDVDWNINDYQTVLSVKAGDDQLISSDIRIGRNKVRSGDTIEVEVPIRAPKKSGTYEVELAPFVSDVGWLEGDAIELEVRVSGEDRKVSDGKKRYMESTGKLKVAVKETNTVVLEIKNNSNHTWTNDSFGIAVLGGRRGLGTNDFSNKLIANAPVKPGQTAEIHMDIFPRAYSAFDYKLRVFANGKLLNRYGIDLNVIGSATLETSATKPVRFESTKVGVSASEDSSVSKVDNVEIKTELPETPTASSLVLGTEEVAYAAELELANNYPAKRYMENSGRVKVAVKETNTLEFEIKNNSNHTWTNDSFGIAVLGGRRGLGTNNFSNKLITNAPVETGEIAKIQMDIFPRAYSSFDYKLRVFANGKLLNRSAIDLNVVGSSTLETSANKPSRFDSTNLETLSDDISNNSLQSSDLGPDIRVHISSFDQNTVTVKGSKLQLKVDGSTKSTYSSAKIEKSGSKVKVSAGGSSYTGNIVRLENTGIVTLDGYENRPAWNESLNDNQFRETVEFRVVDGKLAVINELPIELYLQGLAEVSNGTNSEKIKTIIVAARSYAYHYVTDGTKFPGKPWHLDDSPARSQKYLGYGYEKRSSKVKKAIQDTAGKVVTYDGDVIKVPYFSRSDGRTRSAKEVWGWTNTPYLISVDDPYCEGQTLWGHGVGISGCGSDAMANNGEDHEDIIKYYLKGVGFTYVYARD